MTYTNSTILSDSKGNRINLGKKIGSGGEGDVFEITSSSQNLVAKIYHKPIDSQKQEKLRLMVKCCNDELKAISAWPTDLIFSGHRGPICGFTMLKVSEYKPVHMVYGPSHRKQLFPDANWQFLVRAAKNLASAFSVIHQFGYVVGDVNEGNILVNHHACIRLIDCDSFQVRGHDDKKFFCEVGVAQFTPPELQTLKDFKIERIPNHDNFGLAILIFQLLFMGRHPYSGVFHGSGDMPIEKAIIEYRFAFSKTAHLKNISPPPNSVDLSIVPEELGSAFEQAFTEVGVQRPYRPSAKKWWELLNDLENRLKQCHLEPMHVYYSGLSSCPWCNLETTSGILLFLELETAVKFDLKSIWQKIVSIKQPGSVPIISPKAYNFQPDPLSVPLQNAVRNTKIRRIGGVLIIILALVLNLGLIIPAIILGAIFFFYPGKEQAERKRRQKLFEICRNNWRSINIRWKSEAGDAEFKEQLNQLILLKRNYESIEKEYNQAQVALHNTVKERQLRKYLETCFIDGASIPRVGPNRKATLRSFGVETAADISFGKIRGIPGFGDALTVELLGWRQRMERNFTFNPLKGVEKTDIQLLKLKYQPRMRPLERELQTGIETLNQTQQKIFKTRGDLQSTVETSAKELALAYANLKPFKFL
ncbi:helix-hairpin-helix domain-containing protein [Methanoregula sp.]|uniref:helix-hairpin-helix domain-containing protein n=1 Tax=Methanoregula sp. TaxID=2052170 RepID=UPI00356286DD